MRIVRSCKTPQSTLLGAAFVFHCTGTWYYENGIKNEKYFQGGFPPQKLAEWINEAINQEMQDHVAVSESKTV